MCHHLGDFWYPLPYPVIRVCLLGVEASRCCRVKLNCINFDFSANAAGQLTAASHLIAADSSQVVSVKHMFVAQKVFMKLFMCTIFVTCKSYLLPDLNDGEIWGLSSRRRLECFSCLSSFGKS